MLIISWIVGRIIVGWCGKILKTALLGTFLGDCIGVVFIYYEKYSF
jgi:hypothetical protein